MGQVVDAKKFVSRTGVEATGAWQFAGAVEIVFYAVESVYDGLYFALAQYVFNDYITVNLDVQALGLRESGKGDGMGEGGIAR